MNTGRYHAMRRLAPFALVLAASIAAPGADGPAMHPLEPPDLTSPRAALFGFIDLANQGYVLARSNDRKVGGKEAVTLSNRVFRYMDLSEIPEALLAYRGRESALSIKEVLDRIELPAPEDVPGPDTSPMPDTWRVPHTEIVLARIAEGSRKGEYVFSKETVKRAPGFYAKIKDLPYRTEGPATTPGFHEWYLTEPGGPWLRRVVALLPDWARARTGQLTVWQWVGLAITSIAGALAMLLAYRIGRWRARRFQQVNVLRYIITLVFPVAAMLVPVAMRVIIRDYLVISGKALVTANFLVSLVFLLALMAVVYGTGNRLVALVLTAPRFKQRTIDTQLIRLVARVLSILAVILIFLEGGQRLGIPLTTLLAGAGISGFAVALAAQDSLKNLFGSLMIILDKPFAAGDRIQARGFDGVVEEIGLRSTKLRLLTGHHATIPNDELARSPVENVGRRPHIRRIADLVIPLHTPPAKLEKAVALIKGILENHEGMMPDKPPRVFFNEITREGFNIRFMYWYAPPDYMAFLALGERVNLQLCRAFEEHGIAFSLPTRIACTTVPAAAENHPSGQDAPAS